MFYCVKKAQQKGEGSTNLTTLEPRIKNRRRKGKSRMHKNIIFFIKCSDLRPRIIGLIRGWVNLLLFDFTKVYSINAISLQTNAGLIIHYFHFPIFQSVFFASFFFKTMSSIICKNVNRKFDPALSSSIDDKASILDQNSLLGFPSTICFDDRIRFIFGSIRFRNVQRMQNSIW